MAPWRIHDAGKAWFITGVVFWEEGGLVFFAAAATAKKVPLRILCPLRICFERWGFGRNKIINYFVAVKKDGDSVCNLPFTLRKVRKTRNVCGHAFHCPSIRKWFRRSRTGPLCRAPCEDADGDDDDWLPPDWPGDEPLQRSKWRRIGGRVCRGRITGPG